MTSAAPRAPWPSRAGALAVDLLPGGGVLATTALVALTAPGGGWLRWALIIVGAAALFAVAMNRLVLPHTTGWTLGRALFGIAVRGREPNVAPVRRPRRRTFSDLLTGTVVHRGDRHDRDIRRLASVVLIVAAVLCAAAAVLGYALVYRPERAVDAARSQIADRGPQIVEQVLSYRSETLEEDFARARALVTDGYRPQLIAQQALQAADNGTNEYWPIGSAVLPDPPATARAASMLLALQGRRGADPADRKFISATVRADFDKGPDGHWRVAKLTFLKPLHTVQATR